MSIHATISFNIPELKAALEARKAAIIQADREAAEEIKDLMVGAIQENCRVDTGFEQSRWEADSYVESDGEGKNMMVLGNSAGYSLFLNYGTEKMPPTYELQIGVNEKMAESREIRIGKLQAALNGES
jgi:hypothetical protein